MLFKKIVALCEQQGFFKVVNPFKNNLHYFELGPVGSILFDNLREEWFKHIVTNSEHNVFLSDGDFANSVKFIKELSSEKLPYGVAEYKSIKPAPTNDNLKSQVENDNEESVRSFKTYFLDDTIMKCTMFVPPSNSTRFFHQWQRQRKIWWRKFSAAPGSYSLSEIVTTACGSQQVRVCAKFPWGNEELESIELFSGKHPVLTVEQLQAKENKKKVQAHYLTSTVSLSSMFLNSICECYEETNLFDEHREILRFHRKIAPYKICFATSMSGASKKDDLKDLELYICLLLRQLYISCLLLPRSHKDTLESQYQLYDKLGVPYTIVINESTLKTGIAFLRSRDTTLKEQVSVAQLPTYIEKIYRNY